jgi:K+-transporting ATPase KdpF subunit
LGSVAVVAAALVASPLPASAAGPRLGVFAVALAGSAAVTADLRAAAVVTVIGYLMFDAFLVNPMGELSWQGMPDMRRFAVLVIAVLIGLAVGGLRGRLRQRRRLGPLEAWANGASGLPDVSVIFDEEEWRDAGSGVRAVDGGAVRVAGAVGEGGGAAVNAANVVGLVLAVALAVFLVVALLFPERF